MSLERLTVNQIEPYVLTSHSNRGVRTTKSHSAQVRDETKLEKVRQTFLETCTLFFFSKKCCSIQAKAQGYFFSNTVIQSTDGVFFFLH